MAFKNIADQTNGFYIPCVSLFGPGCAKEIGTKAQNLGAKKALIVTDEGLFKFGVANTIAEYLQDGELVSAEQCKKIFNRDLDENGKPEEALAKKQRLVSALKKDFRKEIDI